MRITRQIFNIPSIHKTAAGFYSFFDSETSRSKRTKKPADYIKSAEDFIGEQNNWISADNYSDKSPSAALIDFIRFHCDAIVKAMAEPYSGTTEPALNGCTYWSTRRAYIELQKNGAAVVYIFDDDEAQDIYKALTRIPGLLTNADTADERERVIDSVAASLETLKEYVIAGDAPFYIPDRVFEHFRDEAKQKAKLVERQAVSDAAKAAALEIAGYCNAMGA